MDVYLDPIELSLSLRRRGNSCSLLVLAARSLANLSNPTLFTVPCLEVARSTYQTLIIKLIAT